MEIREAFYDIIFGAKNFQFWTVFATNDVKSKYRRSKLGQGWITLSVAIFLVVIGSLYQRIFNSANELYLAYLAVGYVTWLFFQDCVNFGCFALIQARQFMLQKSWPASVFIYRLVYREILLFAHHLVLLPFVFWWLEFWPGVAALFFSFLGWILLVFFSFWVSFIVAIISLRFRDFPPIIQSIMRLAFFATPIIWIERDLGDFGGLLLLINPFLWFLKIVRDPLIGYSISVNAWIIAIGITTMTVLISIVMLAHTRKRLAYWL